MSKKEKTPCLIIDKDRFANFALEHIRESLYCCWVRYILDLGLDDKDYTQSWSIGIDEEGVIEKIECWIAILAEINDVFHENIKKIRSQIKNITHGDVNEKLINYKGAIAFLLEQARLVSKDPQSFSKTNIISLNDTVIIQIEIIGQINSYLEAVRKILRFNRDNNRYPSLNEYCILFSAFYLFDEGVKGDVIPVSLRNTEFRKRQTLMSITDPGLGHVYGTCLNNDFFDGVIVHVEHLERGINIPRAQIEPYRIPEPKMISRICFLSSEKAPVSTYVGRPIFEGNVEDSMLKTVRTMSAACNSFFMDGVSECKFSVEGMTSSQAIRFLRLITKNVKRNKKTQAISAAFCLNLPILDDRTTSHNMITDKYEIGLLGIQIVASSGIDKVTWDGTADTYPSQCVIDQLGFKNAINLVHKAHELGLITYFSAGFKLDNIKKAVLTGVDGIGVGGAQILRYMDYSNGNHGPFKKDNISKILKARNEAEESIMGKSIKLLAKLDFLFSQGNLNFEQNYIRKHVFESIQSENIPDLEYFLNDFENKPISITCV